MKIDQSDVEYVTIPRGEYEFRQGTHRRTGIVCFESWVLGAKYHRPDGPALTVRDALTGALTDEIWRYDGRVHREHGPAKIFWGDLKWTPVLGPDVKVWRVLLFPNGWSGK